MGVVQIQLGAGDGGFGSGDMLARIDRWGTRRGVALDLVGIDLNPNSAPVAAARLGARSQLITGDYRDLAGQGAAVLYYTSELAEIRMACDRALVIFGGRVVDRIEAADADDARLMRAAYGLTAQGVPA